MASELRESSTDPKSKTPCRFGFDCGIRDSDHRRGYYHSNPMPCCKFGVNCDNHNIKHRTTFWHYHNSPEVHEMLKNITNVNNKNNNVGDIVDIVDIDNKSNKFNTLNKTSEFKQYIAPKTTQPKTFASILKQSAESTKFAPKSAFDLG